MAKILNGKEVVSAIITDCATKVSDMLTSGELAPKLSVICVGDDSSSDSYLKGIEKRAAEAGVLFDVHKCECGIEKQDLLDLIEDLNDDDKVHGILLMRPLPGKLKDSEKEICEAIATEKDVDAARQLSVAGPYLGNNDFVPCTAESCMAILHHFGIEVEGKRAVVIGRSLVVGKPVAHMLQNENATVTVCHSKTQDVEKITKQADIVIVATGTPKKFGKKYFTKDQVVIDAGINWDPIAKKLCGDVNFDEVAPVVGAITPVPGGVGSVTSAILIQHTIF